MEAMLVVSTGFSPFRLIAQRNKKEVIGTAFPCCLTDSVIHSFHVKSKHRSGLYSAKRTGWALGRCFDKDFLGVHA